MTRLAIEAAPAVDVPRRFLLSAPVWGVIAGALLAIGGAALLRSRWHPGTLALTHAFTLGVLGNLMFGSLLQFLPAAAGARLLGVPRGGFLLHGALNLGVVLLVLGLWAMRPVLLCAAGGVLAAAFVGLALMTLPGLATAIGQRLLRAGLGAALGAALVTAALGTLLAFGLGGRGVMPLPARVDVHAAWGVLGWTVLLLAVVARVVMPMFQGTAAPSAPAHAVWVAALLVTLVAGSVRRLGADEAMLLRFGVAAAVLSFALPALWRQWRTPRPRNPGLRAFWHAGLLALAGAAITLGRGDGLLAGVLGIGVALPLLAVGMQLEIVAFLGWIELHRRCGRGVHLPGVQLLLPEADKRRVLCGLLVAALLSLAAAGWPVDALARAAGAATMLAYAFSWWVLRGVRRRGARFADTIDAMAGAHPDRHRRRI